MELTPFYQKKMTCISCSNRFNTTKVRSKFVKVEKIESDFRPIYLEVNPLFYNVFVCEHCGFSFTEDFSSYFAPGVKDVIQEKITSEWIPRSFGEERTISEAIDTYKLAFVSGLIKTEKSVVLAGLTLRIAWLYRSQNEVELERRFLSVARNQYIQSYSKQDYEGTQMSEERIMYIIGELSKRLGDFDEATRYFSKVIEKQKSTLDPKLIEMAKEQWQEMRTVH